MAQQVHSETEKMIKSKGTVVTGPGTGASSSASSATATPREFETWRKNFILKLYDNTKDAVEVAQRNYLESRLANGIQREMAEIRKKYLSLLYTSGNLDSDSDIMPAFECLEEEMDVAVKKLKERSNAYRAMSSSTHRLAFQVETMSLKELEAIELPNYSTFLFDPELVSFGPLSERWEKLKTNLDQEVMLCFQRSPLTLGRSCATSYSSSLNMSISELETTDDGASGRDNENTSADGDSAFAEPGPRPPGAGSGPVPGAGASSDTPVASGSGSSQDRPGKDGEVFVVGCEAKKPSVMTRTKHQRSFRKQISNSLHQLLTSAAQNSDVKRVGNR